MLSSNPIKRQSTPTKASASTLFTQRVVETFTPFKFFDQVRAYTIRDGRPGIVTVLVVLVAAAAVTGAAAVVVVVVIAEVVAVEAGVVVVEVVVRQ
ncbi:hypothetical protein ElyMa_004910600 [Elysia marginata]|uniref:Uncharacterized protein n=1 Tax=Elysia marginata TaxID=1093978 RepID=A0AAV4IWR6_9GAST|nr:hypothetical protein ElyMa_004910600 [Elysia marginata]